MTREDVIRRYLNLHPDTPMDATEYAFRLIEIQQLVAAVEDYAFKRGKEAGAASEREECAKVCADIWEEDGTAYDCREAIKARGK